MKTPEKQTKAKPQHAPVGSSIYSFLHPSASAVNGIFHLQETIGNREVERLFQAGIVQAKLTVGRPDDPYEREADRIADQVMRMPDPKLQRKEGCPECRERKDEYIQSKSLDNNILQRQTDDEEEETVQTKSFDSNYIQPQVETGHEDEEEKPIQAKAASGEAPHVSPAMEARINSLRGGGQPLDAKTRAYFEPRFGADFSQVRVHTNAGAHETARSVNARTFTTGRHIVMAAGQYSPETNSGKKLLAHELTHALQQRSGLCLQAKDQPLQRIVQAAALPAPNAAGAEKKRGEAPVYWSVDRIKMKAFAVAKTGATLKDVAVFLYGNPDAAAELAAVNSLILTAPLPPGQRLYLTGKPLTNAAFRHLNESPKIPLGADDPEAFIAKKKNLDKELGADFAFIVKKLDESHYSDADEGEVIAILRKWGTEKFTTRPDLYPNGGEFLDALFSKLIQKSKDVGIITTQWSNYYNLIFNHFNRVNEVIQIRDAYSRMYKGDSGSKELSFGSFFWEEVKEGRIRDQIFAYFQGLKEAGIGLVEGVYLLLTNPKKVLEGIGNLPKTLKILWKNREKMWNDFLNAKPEEQARVIGRIFGEAEIIIASFGAGSGGRAATAAPELATAMEVVAVTSGEAAMAAISKGGAISINLGQLGVEAGRLTVLASKTSELSVKGKEKAEEIEKSKSLEKIKSETAPEKKIKTDLIEKKRRFPKFPAQIEAYIEKLEALFPKLRNKLKPVKRRPGRGMFEEKMTTGGGEFSFKGKLEEGISKEVQIDDILLNGQIKEIKAWSPGTWEKFSENQKLLKIQELEYQMSRQSRFISENSLPNGIWEISSHDLFNELVDIRFRLKIKNIDLHYIE